MPSRSHKPVAVGSTPAPATKTITSVDWMAAGESQRKVRTTPSSVLANGQAGRPDDQWNRDEPVKTGVQRLNSTRSESK